MDALQESLNQLQKMFTQRMDVYQGELQAAAPSTNIINLTSEFASFRQFIITALRNLQDQVGLLAHHIDDMEMRSRRKLLLLHGLPEEKKEDTNAVVVKAVVEKLKVPGFSLQDIARCHRMGQSSTPGKPRPVLFEFHDWNLKNKVWYSKTSLKGTGITMSEFLTKARHEIFMAARQRFGVSKCWTRDGFVFVLGPGGVRHRINNILELDQIEERQVTRTEATTKEPVGASRTRRAGAAGKK